MMIFVLYPPETAMVPSPLLARALAAAVVFATVGPAFADTPPAPRPCPFVSQIDNFKEIDDYSAIIETSPAKRYKVTFMNTCREMRWALFARVEARPGVCLTTGDKIVVGRHGFVDRCVIQTIEQLPPKAPASQASY